MAPKFLQHEGVSYVVEGGAVQSVYPPESHFGFTYWSLMIPPVKPKDILMLGCGAHTVPDLIDKVWGHGRSLTCDDGRDAFGFAHALREVGSTFDYIIVDVYQGATPHPGIFKDDFLHDLYAISTGLIAVNSATFEQEAPYQPYFEVVLAKALNNNVVTFLRRRGSPERQYFALKP